MRPSPSKRAEPACTSAEACKTSSSRSRGRSRAISDMPKRAEPAFTSAEVRETSSSRSRGRSRAISDPSKQAEPAFTSAEACKTSSSRSRGRSRAISNVPNRQPYGKLLAASGILLAVVLVSALMTTFLQAPNLDALADATAVPSVEPTPSPEPTITPTPAVYAPFGAQYGYGGANLIPDTPTPNPVTPVPTAAPTDTPAPTAVPTRTLKKNSTGEDVKKLQQALIDLGYLADAADGTFGANTQEAVTRFQAVNGLSADGLAGAKTQELLYSGNALSADQAPKPDFLILVNRQNKLGTNDAPTDLVTIENVLSADIVKVKYSGTKADRTATEALGQMLSAAIADGISNFQISSAYRTYSEQQKLVDNSVAKYRKNNPDWSRDRCLSATYNTVAPAGTSEHQTGLAFDITVPGVSFTGTQQQKWLHAHCAEYGFIVRFTAEKQKLTGFVAESWHFRYVGQEAAAVITQNGWCLEEYVEKMGL